LGLFSTFLILSTYSFPSISTTAYFYFALFFAFFFISTLASGAYNNLNNIINYFSTPYNRKADKKKFFLVCIENFFLTLTFCYFLLLVLNIGSFFFYTFYHVSLGNEHLNSSDLCFYFLESSSNTGQSSNQNPNISAHTSQTINTVDHTWATTIRTLSIYGLGGVKMAQLAKGGSPVQKLGVLAGTLTFDAVSKMMHQAIIDPTYASRMIENFRYTDNTRTDAHMSLTKTGQTVLFPQNNSTIVASFYVYTYICFK